MKDAYIWYSGATDVTGIKLAEALGVDHGREQPPASKKIIVGWGTKTKDDVSFGAGTNIFNHPNNIRHNRDKLAALNTMKSAGVNIAPFSESTSKAALTKAGVKCPVIGRTKYHQGGKGFWNCPTPTHIKAAREEGAEYFQNLIEITEEYRLHVVDDKVIYAVKKTKRTVKEMEEAYVRHEMERQEKLAIKNNNTLDEATMETILRRQAKKVAQDGANMLIRSNRMGWKFKSVKPGKELAAEAIKACKALDLNFGAVDCCTDVSGKHWVIEVNTGPGLEATPFKAWVAALKNLISTTGKTTSAKKVQTRAIKEGKGKGDLLRKLALAQEMVVGADDEEAAVLDRAFKRLFG